MAAAQREEDGQGLRKAYCLDEDVLDARFRLLELSNWISYLRQENASERGGV